MGSRTFPDSQAATSRLDDIFIYWRHSSATGVARHAVMRDYAAVRTYLPRLLRHLDTELPMEILGNELVKLREHGQMVSLVFGSHCLGLGRPHVLGSRGQIDRADPPFLICREPAETPQSPCFPVLASSRDEAATFVRRVEARAAIAIESWRAYRCERLNLLAEPLPRRPRPSSSTGFLTELEAQLVAALRGRARGTH